jgi:hypothetical protein
MNRSCRAGGIRPVPGEPDVGARDPAPGGGLPAGGGLVHGEGLVRVLVVQVGEQLGAGAVGEQRGLQPVEHLGVVGAPVQPDGVHLCGVGQRAETGVAQQALGVLRPGRVLADGCVHAAPGGDVAEPVDQLRGGVRDGGERDAAAAGPDEDDRTVLPGAAQHVRHGGDVVGRPDPGDAAGLRRERLRILPSEVTGRDRGAETVAGEVDGDGAVAVQRELAHGRPPGRGVAEGAVHEDERGGHADHPRMRGVRFDRAAERVGPGGDDRLDRPSRPGHAAS